MWPFWPCIFFVSNFNKKILSGLKIKLHKCLPVKLQIKKKNKKKTIRCVLLKSTVDDCSRAAAVALQAWFAPASCLSIWCPAFTWDHWFWWRDTCSFSHLFVGIYSIQAAAITIRYYVVQLYMTYWLSNLILGFKFIFSFWRKTPQRFGVRALARAQFIVYIALATVSVVWTELFGVNHLRLLSFDM